MGLINFLRLFIPFFFFNRDLLGVYTIITSHEKAPLRLPQIYDIYDQLKLSM